MDRLASTAERRCQCMAKKTMPPSMRTASTLTSSRCSHVLFLPALVEYRPSCIRAIGAREQTLRPQLSSPRRLQSRKAAVHESGRLL